MHTNHRIPKKIVMRSRFRSTTEDEPRVELTPPPNRSDSPPPLPLCSRTSRITTRLVMTRIMESPMTIAFYPSPAADKDADVSLRCQFTIPADLSELPGVEAGTADEGAVHVRLRHDRRDVAGL